MPRTFDRWTPRNDKDPNRFGLDYTDPQGAIDESVTRSATRIRDNFPKIIKDTTGVDLTDKNEARSALGLGYGITAGTVAQGNDSRIVGAEQATNRGVANGYAPLNSLGKIDVTFLPAPTLSKSDVGLGNVDNTADTAKPISTATQTALDGKAATSHTHAQSDITGLSTSLSGKSDTGHTHTATEISDSTSVGRSVLTAATATAARSAIGAGTSSLELGTTSTTAKAGNYQPAAADISDATTTGRSVLTAADAAAARTAIGAGTSSLTIGTTSTTAKAGDYQPSSTDISDSTATGRALVTATDAAAARSTIGLSAVDNTSDATKNSATATLQNKTLTDPKINRIKDSNGNLLASFTVSASAVNYLTIANAAAGGPPTIGVAGSDTDIPLFLKAKGASSIWLLDGNSSAMFQVSRGGTGTLSNYPFTIATPSGNAVYFGAQGSDTDVSLYLYTQNGGLVLINGSPAGAKVSVPANAYAAGKPGQWAASSTHIYAYTGDGSTHAWVRTSASSW